MTKHSIVFDPSQKECLSKLEAFLSVPVTKDLKTRMFVISGKAGTGKTTIIKYALQKKIKEDQSNIDRDDATGDLFSTPNVVGIAMAHKAKNVLQKSIHYCSTFASCFGLVQCYRDDGSTYFERPKKNLYQKILLCEMFVEVFVHDECSMYDKEMFDYVQRYTNSNSKFIFMGDRGQLPPISSEEDKDSPIFEMKLPEINYHYLEERHRQSEDSPIVPLSDIVYNEIFGKQTFEKVFEALNFEKMIDGKGYTSLSYRNFLEHYKNSTDDYRESKVIAYRRDKVNDYNTIIRKFLYKNPDFDYIEGEIIYMNDTYIHTYKMGTETRTKWRCYNSDEYKIIRVEDTEIDGIHCHTLYVDKTGYMHLAEYKDPFIPVVSKKGLKAFNTKLHFLKQNALNEPFKKQQKWKMYYDFKSKFANISYAYAYTGHKAQGSGFKNVYVDIVDIVSIGPISNKRKLQAIYTALTRATDKVIFLKNN
jgi:exodeoxyribonuclease-5